MIQKNKRIWHLLLAAVIFIISCAVPSITQPQSVAPQPGAVDTIVAQTAGAASTQTVRALPTSTKTPTATPTPRNTDTVTPTPTSTVIFRFKTPTVPGSSSSGGGSGGGSGASADNFACDVISISPGSGTAFSSRKSFDAKIKISNTGKKDWESTSVDYAYLSGDKLHRVSVYDLKATVNNGSSTTIAIDMESPKNPGVYSTKWGLKTGADNFFCTFTITIVVK